MTLKSEMCCPTSVQDCKVSIKKETERLKQREQRKTTREFKDAMAEGFKSVAEDMEKERLIISTGDYVPHDIWTQEKLDELQRVVDKIKQEEQENMRYSFELSDVKVADSQWSQIENAAHYLEDNIDDSMQS